MPYHLACRASSEHVQHTLVLLFFSHSQRCSGLTPGSALRDYSWQCSGDLKGCQDGTQVGFCARITCFYTPFPRKSCPLPKKILFYPHSLHKVTLPPDWLDQQVAGPCDHRPLILPPCLSRGLHGVPQDPAMRGARFTPKLCSCTCLSPSAPPDESVPCVCPREGPQCPFVLLHGGVERSPAGRGFLPGPPRSRNEQEGSGSGRQCSVCLFPPS